MRAVSAPPSLPASIKRVLLLACIRAFQILEIREIKFQYGGKCSAALVDSDQGRKIVLYKYEKLEAEGYWLPRFYDLPQAPNKSL